MERRRAHVLITGRVQGVFLRAYTRDAARLIGVAGWVRNLPDGRVETILEGEKSRVEKVIQFCQKGPPGAYVSNVQVNWEEARGEFQTFEILH